MIAAALLADVATRTAALAAAGGYEELLASLRNAFPGIHISVCGEDDVPPRLPPAAENAVCRLYYVDANEHCLKLTNDAEAASGIVVALCADDRD